MFNGGIQIDEEKAEPVQSRQASGALNVWIFVRKKAIQTPDNAVVK